MTRLSYIEFDLEQILQNENYSEFGLFYRLFHRTASARRGGIKNLSLYSNKGQLRRVNYAALDVEELGSVYESLLDFAPKFDTHRRF
jgi:hypothetical protein